MQEVTIYTKAGCPFCDRAKALLSQKGVQSFKEIRIDLDENARDEMINLSNRKTVPQIFIGATHVGGFDDLAALNHKGELDSLLNK